MIEMDERRNYSDGVGDKMYQLQLVVKEKTLEEIPHREVEATLKVRYEDVLCLHIFGRDVLPHCCLPLHLRL
jgi:hypothetical protein